MAKRVATIDIGSNSTRLIIYERSSRFAFRVLYETKSRVRVSEGAYSNNSYLQEKPMQRTLDALCDFSNIINSFGARKTLCVATSALRDAPNRTEFIKQVKDKTGISIKVIDGQKEAYLGALACTSLLPEQDSAITLDIGGGSCELAIIEQESIKHQLSLSLGSVRLKELYLDKNDIEGAKKYINSELESLGDVFSSKTLIGIGGTFRAISLLLLKDSPLKKLHGFSPSTEKFTNLLESIIVADEAKLKKIGISKSRLDVIKAGALILHSIIKKLGVSKLITSGVGVREGLFLKDLLRNQHDKFPHNFNPSIRYIQDRFILNKTHANQMFNLSKKIFELTHSDLNIDKSHLYELSVAAKIGDASQYIKHSLDDSYAPLIVEELLEYRFTHEQVALISTICSYANYKRLKKLLPSKEIVEYLSYVLKITSALLLHHPKNIDFEIELIGKVLVVSKKTSSHLVSEMIEDIKDKNIFDVKISTP